MSYPSSTTPAPASPPSPYAKQSAATTGFGHASTILLSALLMAVYAVVTDPLFAEVLCKRFGVFDPRVLGTLDPPTIRPLSANDKANFATIQALVERGSWVIADDGSYGPAPRSLFLATGDMARIEGRYYSVRPPVLPFLLSGLYWVEVNVLGWRFGDLYNALPGKDFWRCYFSLVWLVAGLATAVMAVQLARCLAMLGASSGPCWAAGLLLGLGSLALPYATVLNHHAVAGALIATTSASLLRGQLTGRFSTGTAVAVGLCAGLAATVDIAAGGLFLIAAGFWVASTRVLRRRLLWGLLAALAPGLLHAVLNYQITGDIVPALVRPEYYRYPNTSIAASDLSGLPHDVTPRAFVSYLAGLLWEPRGILVYSAPLLFAALAAVRLICTPGHPLRFPALWLAGWLCAYLIYLGIYTNNYSGACYGIRWTVPMLPAGYLLLFGGWNLLSRTERWAAAVALATSVPLAWTGALYGAWQLIHAFPVLTWTIPMPNWGGTFWQWAGSVPYLGWAMILAPVLMLLASTNRALAARKRV